MTLRRGTVARTTGGVYEVALDTGEMIEAALRGRLKQERRTGDRVVAGDHVLVASDPSGGYTIESVEERRSELARRAPGQGARRAKVIVANVDQVVAVFAAASPEPRLRMLDRFLVLAEANDLAAAVVVNKLDLVDEATTRTLFGAYEAADYPVLFTSVPERQGLNALHDRLCGNTSVLTGPSGVGKSSLLNALQPGLGLRTATIGEAAQKGRHTTVSATLIPLDCGGFVADTPGLRELGLWNVQADELDLCFPELRRYRDECRFAGSCSHTHEPGCGVRAAVERGEVPAERYESYCVLREELSESRSF